MPSSMTRSSFGFSNHSEVGWAARGLCRHDPNLWTSEQSGILGERIMEQAVHICKRHCPVNKECAASIGDPLPRVGVWAGIQWQKPPKSEGPVEPQPGAIACGYFCEQILREEEESTSSARR